MSGVGVREREGWQRGRASWGMGKRECGEEVAPTGLHGDDGV